MKYIFYKTKVLHLCLFYEVGTMLMKSSEIIPLALVSVAIPWQSNEVCT